MTYPAAGEARNTTVAGAEPPDPHAPPPGCRYHRHAAACHFAPPSGRSLLTLAD